MTSSDNEQLHEEHSQLQKLLAEHEAGRPIDPSELLEDPSGFDEDEVFRSELGPYRLLRVLGHGGQGVVYLAEDTRLDRRVALKLLSSTGAATPGAKDRFRREAMAASRLQHPGICTVLEAGEIEGQRFLAMEFVNGDALPTWITKTRREAVSESGDRRARVDLALEVVERIARAIQAAHDAGIVHRDLKPANIRLRTDGSPVVLDFGLARDDSDPGQTLTRPGDVLGTPAYLPPERVRGEATQASATTDVYGLGTILYECLTGVRAFDAPTRERLYHQILTAAVVDPRRHDPAIPREARFVVETALEKSPERRYATASELADDLARLRARQPIHARTTPLWLRAVRWVQTETRVAVATIAAFVLLVGGVVVSWILIGARDEALNQIEARALVGQSARVRGWDPDLALRSAREAHLLAPSAATRSALYEVLAGLHETVEWRGGVEGVDAFYSGSGDRIVTVTRRFLQLLTSEGEPIGDQVRLGGATSARLDPGGERVVVACQDGGNHGGSTLVISASSGEVLADLSADVPAAAPGPLRWSRRLLAEFSPVPGSDLILTAASGQASLWRLAEADSEPLEIWRDDRAESSIVGVRFSPDGRHFAVGEEGGAVRVFDAHRADAAEGQAESAVRAEVCRMHFQGPVQALAFDPVGERLVTGSAGDGEARVWAFDGRLIEALPTFGTEVHGLCFSPSGSLLSVCDNDRAVHLYEASGESGRFRKRASLTAHEGDVFVAGFSPDGERILTASRDETARLFDPEGREIASFRSGLAPASSARFSPGGGSVITTCRDGSFRIHALAIPGFEVWHEEATVVRLVASDRWIAASLRDGSLVAHDRETRRRHRLRGGSGLVLWSLVMSLDGSRLVHGNGEGLLAWDLSGEVPKALDWSLGFGAVGLAADPHGSQEFVAGHLDGAHAFRLDSASAPRPIVEGSRVGLVSWLSDGRVTGLTQNRLWWDLASREQARVGSFRELSVLSASPDGRWLAIAGTPYEKTDDRGSRFGSASGSNVIQILDVRSGELWRRLEGHGSQIPGLCFSPDGRRLASVSRDGTARLWDVETGEPLVILRGHRGGVVCCAFTPDGKTLLTGGTDGAIRSWPVDFEQIERMAAERAIEKSVR